jgi:predicted nucleotidyltransferase
MKTKLMPIMLTAVFTVNAFADVELKRKNIKTVEDVKEYRAQVIDKMTERLDSGELNQQRANVLAKKIALLSDKPLPTQEQIDWRVENRSDIISMKRKGKKQKKKMLKHKREIFTG